MLEWLRKKMYVVTTSQWFLRPYLILSKVLSIDFIYLVREGLSTEHQLDIRPQLEPCESGFLTADEMKEIAELPEEVYSEEGLLGMLDDGCRCLGIRHNNRLAAYTFSNLKSFKCYRIVFPLKDDEAYLFAARTLTEFRGKNLAPYLRYELYGHLAAMGRTKCYSVTQCFNSSSIRFKEKLGARPLALYLYLEFFEKFHWTFPLKVYEKNEALPF